MQQKSKLIALKQSFLATLYTITHWSYQSNTHQENDPVEIHGNRKNIYSSHQGETPISTLHWYKIKVVS